MNVFDLCAKLTLDKSEYEQGLSKASGIASKIGGGIVNGLQTVAKVSASAVVAGAGAVTAVTKQAVDAYASYEQLSGGILKLFGAGTYDIQEYAKQQGKSVDEIRGKFNQLQEANNAVLVNADKAYKTAGMSANEYIETVTSFSASLIKSLGGDTEKASEYADRAIRDMSDNANTFGTSLESIQNAYQGFAKENYTMLDNLKLGYGGTKEGMQQLIEDASKLTDVQKELGITVDADSLSYANIVDAISVVQKNMQIMGTTEREAMGTIEGSMNMMKASWENVLMAIGSGSDELEMYIDNLVESVTAVATNVMPVVEKSISGIGTLVENLAPVIAEAIPRLVNDTLPKLVEAGAQLVGSLVKALMDNGESILQTGVDLLNRLITGLTNSINNMQGTGQNIVSSLGKFIQDNAKTLIKNAGELIKAIGTGLSQAIPDLLNTAVDIVLSLVDYILDNSDNMIDGAISLIVSLGEGLIQNIVKLTEKAPEIIRHIVEALTRNAPNIVAGALSLIISLADGLIQSLPKLVLQIPTIIRAIVEGLSDGIAEMMNTGMHLVDGLWEGIKKKWQNLKENVRNLGKNLIQEVNNVFGIRSPSRVFRQIGEYCIEGLQQGSDELFGDSGLTAKVTADVQDKATGNNDILQLLESYLPTIASGQNIYLDGDALVSGTAKRMDMALGRLSARRA